MNKSISRRLCVLQKLATTRFPTWVTITLRSGLEITTGQNTAAIFEAIRDPLPDRRIEYYED